MLYTVTIGDTLTKVRMDNQTLLTDYISDEPYKYPASEYVGGYHNYNGLKGAIIDRAVTKLFGKNCYWFGNYDCLYCGQVFEALTPTKNNSNPGSSSRTGVVLLDVSPDPDVKI